MPHDPTDPFESGRSPRLGGVAGGGDDEDFWGRAKRTRKDDKKSRKRRRDTPTATPAVDPLSDAPAAPPPRRPAPRPAPSPAPAPAPPGPPPRGRPAGPVGPMGGMGAATDAAVRDRRSRPPRPPATSQMPGVPGGPARRPPVPGSLRASRAAAQGTGTTPAVPPSARPGPPPGTGRVPRVTDTPPGGRRAPRNPETPAGEGRRMGSTRPARPEPEARGRAAAGAAGVAGVAGAAAARSWASGTEDTGRRPPGPRSGRNLPGSDTSATGPVRRIRNRAVPRGPSDWDDAPAISGQPQPQALPAGDASLADRLDGLAARATPPGGHASIPTMPTPAAAPGFDRPRVSPAEVAHEAMTSSYDDSYGDAGYDDDPYGGDRDEDDVDRSRRPGCGRLGLALLIVAGVLCLAVVAGGLWVRRQIDPGGSPGDRVQVEIARGQSTGDIGRSLAEVDVITNSTVWTWYVRLRGGGDIQAGTYELQQNMSMGEALDALTDGPATAAGADAVTIPEGLTLNQTVARMVDPENGVESFSQSELERAILDPSVRSAYLPADQPNIEGTLFPETYSLDDDVNELELLRRMVGELDATLDDLDLNGGAQRLGMEPYEVLIIASLVEEETRIADERPQVARVIYNRLAQDIPLQIDATSCYEKGEVPCRLTTADLESDSPYNTRRRPGLPPSPIASPGRASIEAALNPADGDWLYYVLDPELGEGRHLFTASEDEFLEAKERCRDAGLGCG